MFKKVLAMLLAGVLAAAALVGCDSSGGSSSGSGTSGASGEWKYLAEGQVYPEEEVKIGVTTYNKTDTSFLCLKQYCDYLEEYLNIKFVYSENLSSAEDETAFIENCAISGCKGIIFTYDVIGHDVIDLCEEYEIYCLLGPSDVSLPQGDVYEQYKTNDYWLGGLTNGNFNYQAGKLCAEYLGSQGCKNVFYAAGMTMVEMFAQALKGWEDGASAYPEMTFKVVEGFPDMSADFQAAQKEALADPTCDGVSGLANPVYWAQPIADAGRDDIKLACGSGGLDENNRAAMESGLMDYETIQLPEDFTMSVVMLLNVLDGNTDMAKPNGVTELIDMAIIGVDNYDDYMAYYNIIQSGEQFYDINDVTSCIKSLNPDASFDKMLSIYQERDISAIQARHASY
ncbi:MAG: hypothetical protein E7242_03045 [Lachnospiraceae bacterium]|nr:hypothetical protein [Lachnospiraceae bacterium]